MKACAFFCSLALKWFRKKGNIQVEVEEMQEEQRSLSSIQTLSVRRLLKDRCVRWQVITIAVVNIGMQLSGIDAVSGKNIVGSFSFLFCMCNNCALNIRVCLHIVTAPCCALSI